MKRMILSGLLIASVTAPLFAQTNAVTRFFSDYADDQRFTKVSISGSMFQLANHIDAENADEQELKDAISKIEGMIVLVCDSCTGNEKAMFNGFESRLNSEFEELMTVKEGTSEVRFSIRENSGKIKELLIAVGEANEFVLVDIWGEIDLNQVKKITESMNVQGMDSFDPKTAKAALSVNYYPNPIKAGVNGNLTVPDELLGATLKLHSASGQLLHEEVINQNNIQVPLSKHQDGTYIMSLVKDNKRVFIEKIVVSR